MKKMQVNIAKKILVQHAKNCRKFNPESPAADAIEVVLKYIGDFEASIASALRESVVFSQRK